MLVKNFSQYSRQDNSHCDLRCKLAQIQLSKTARYKS